MRRQHLETLQKSWAMRLGLAMLVVFGVIEATALTSAFAQDSEEVAETQPGQAEYERGREAYLRQEYPRALDEFRRSYAISAEPGLLYNIGQAAERAGETEVAITSFERFIEEDPDSPKVPEVERNLVILRASERGSRTDFDLAPEDDAVGELDADEDDSSVFESPWFWVVLVAAIGGGVTAAILLSGGDDDFPEGTWGSGTALLWEL